MAAKQTFSNTAEERSRHELEYVLRAEKKIKEGPRNEVPLISVEQALARESVYEVESRRNEVRVLFISKDETLLNPSKQSLDGFLDISKLFDEVHILILRPGIPTKFPVLRVAPNVWLYTATARTPWWTPITALRLLREQLVFVGGLRADLIVARDPFESALVTYVAGKQYDRPTQVHVLEDYTKPEFLLTSSHARLKRFIAGFLIQRFVSVRTATYALEEMLRKRFTSPDIKVLPRFTNYEALRTATPQTSIQDTYRPFSFVILYIGRLGHDSTLYRVIDAARSYLQNPRVGLVVLGNGPAKKEFEKRTELLGIKKQVVFETRTIDHMPFLTSANVLIVSDNDSDGDETALKGAAAGVPLVLSRNTYRNDVFSDGESALLFDNENVDELHQKLSTIFNDVGLRRRLTLTAQHLIKNKFHDDPEVYRRTYRASIEQALFVADALEITPTSKI